MTLKSADVHELGEVALAAAITAGEMIVESRPQNVQHKAGQGGLASQVVTEIDRQSEDIILASINPTLERYELGLLTEEQVDNGGRLTADYFWCIDPLDGTLPFIEGLPGYAVSIALVARDGTPVIGVVYDPVQATSWHAISGAGAFRNRDPWPKRSLPYGAEMSVFVDRSFLNSDSYPLVIDALTEIADEMGLAGVEVQPAAGAVLNAVGVLENPVACYVKQPKPSGGGSLWDFAATTCLFNELAAVATDIHGDPLELNRAESTNMNHRGVLFATHEALAERIRALHQRI